MSGAKRGNPPARPVGPELPGGGGRSRAHRATRSTSIIASRVTVCTAYPRGAIRRASLESNGNDDRSRRPPAID
jgi:hypothetical protein